MDENGRRSPVTLERWRLSRRELLAGGVRLAAGGALALTATGWGARLGLAQGTPPPAATPVVGLQPNGTRIWQVTAGMMDMQNLIEAALFFPDKLTINAGDSVYFAGLDEFHTATFLAGQTAPPLLIPQKSAAPVNGHQPFMFNPAAIFPAGGTTVDGSHLVNSGIPLQPGAPPFVATFPKAGTYDFECLVHRVMMKGTIVVQAAAGTLPSQQADYDKASADRWATLLAQGKALVAQTLAAAKPGGGATPWEVSVGATDGKQIDVDRFLPDTLTIKVGDTVRWTYHGMAEPHTVTFLGGTAYPQDPIVEMAAAGPPAVVANPAVYYPTGSQSYDGKGLVGSGYIGVNAALLGGQPAPAGTTYQLTFTAAGTYPYYCSLHGDPVRKQGMLGTIVVK